MANRHEHVTELLSLYIDHQLSANDRARVEAHLTSCPECRRELLQLQRLVALLHSCPQIKPPRSFALDSNIVQPRSPAVRLSRWAPAVTALAAVLLAALLFADIQMFSSRAVLPASQPSIQVLGFTVAPAPGATTPAPAATAPASLAVALPTSTASVASPPEPTATIELEKRALAAPAAPAVEASAADALSAAGAAGEMPTQAVAEVPREGEITQPTALQQKALATPAVEPSEAPALATLVPTPVAAATDEGEHITKEASTSLPEASPQLEPATTAVPASVQEAPRTRIWLLRTVEALLALILVASLALWLRRPT